MREQRKHKVLKSENEWYKDPQIIVTISIGVLGAVATIVSGLL